MEKIITHPMRYIMKVLSKIQGYSWDFDIALLRLNESVANGVVPVKIAEEDAVVDGCKSAGKLRLQVNIVRIRSIIHACIQILILPFLCFPTFLCIFLFRLFSHSFIHSLLHSFAHSFIHIFIGVFACFSLFASCA